MKLKELQKWYTKYEDFWTQWKEYKLNGLTQKEILAIEIYRDNKFYLDTCWLELFNSVEQLDKRLIEPLVRKLEQNYCEYKDLVCIKFQFSMMYLALQYGWEDFYRTPIELLKVETELKENLRWFRCKTFLEIEEKYGEDGYKSNEAFINVLKFKKIISQQFGSERIGVGNAFLSDFISAN